MYTRLPVSLPAEAESYLLLHAQKRNSITARRVHLLQLLWRERYITREGLVQRVETMMGYPCFGSDGWKDNFYRDMGAVKAALKRSGYILKYSRNAQRLGYYLAGEPALHPDEEKAIWGALRELDQRQIEIYKRMSPAQKFTQACSITNLARKVSAVRTG